MMNPAGRQHACAYQSYVLRGKRVCRVWLNQLESQGENIRVRALVHVSCVRHTRKGHAGERAHMENSLFVSPLAVLALRSKGSKSAVLSLLVFGHYRGSRYAACLRRDSEVGCFPLIVARMCMYEFETPLS